MKVFLVYLDLGYDGISLEDSIIYTNQNSANSYRWRMQNKERFPDNKWRIKTVLLK